MKYLIQGTEKFKGGILLEFNEQGRLISLKIDGEITDQQHDWFMMNCPIKEDGIKHLRATGKFIITNVNEEPTFDDFYNEYANKVGRKKAENAWNRMSKTARLKAFAFIGRYKYRVQTRGIAMMYPATYLNQEPWND